MDKLKEYIKSIEEDIISYRRHLHKHAEISGSEYETQKYIKNFCEDNALEVTLVETGLYADLIVNKDFKMLGLRADIDALPTVEANTDLEYCSINKGAMHACGHDGHTAILLGTVKTLINFKSELKYNVRFIFQHDEEDKGGAKDFIKVGALKNLEALYGLHLNNGYEAGQVAYKYDQMNAGGDSFILTVNGKGSHGAYPQDSIDPIVCSAQIINTAQSIVSRNVGPLDSTVITFGKINGGTVKNSIPSNVVLEGVIRNLDLDTKKYVWKRFEEVVYNTAKAYGCSIDLVHVPSYPPLKNNEKLVNNFRSKASLIFKDEDIIDKKYPTLGLEDFAYYTHEVPSCFYNLGSKKIGKDGEVLSAHSEDFNFDESSLYYGTLMHSVLVLFNEEEN